MTIRELLDRAAGCNSKQEANDLLEEQIGDVLLAEPLLLREEARTRVLSNIGYLSGYLDRAGAARVLYLFGARHPFFGGIDDWPKTPEETVAIGYQVGTRVRREKEQR